MNTNQQNCFNLSSAIADETVDAITFDEPESFVDNEPVPLERSFDISWKRFNTLEHFTSDTKMSLKQDANSRYSVQ